MRKRVLVMLALMMCLLVQMVPVSAAEVSAADLDSLPKPSQSTNLILSWDLGGDSKSGYTFIDSGDGTTRLSNYAGSGYKILSYEPNSGLYVYSVTAEVETYDPNTEEYYSGESVEIRRSSSLTQALSEVSVTEDSLYFDVSSSLSAYTIFFSPYASSLSDAVYGLKNSELLKHVFDPNADKVAYTGQEILNDVSVELIETGMTGVSVTSARYILRYNLTGFRHKDEIIPEVAKRVYVDTIYDGIVCNEMSTGSVEFTITNVRNHEYQAYVYTDHGHRYYTTFTIDFATGNTREQFTGSYDVPVVTFSGIPEENGRTDILYLTVDTGDIPVQFIWNGELMNKMYSSKLEIPVNQNGVFRYSATSEVGRTAVGELTIDCFAEGIDAVPLSGQDLVSHDDHLVQTGLNAETTSHVALYILVVGAVLASLGVVVVMKKRRG